MQRQVADTSNRAGEPKVQTKLTSTEVALNNLAAGMASERTRLDNCKETVARMEVLLRKAKLCSLCSWLDQQELKKKMDTQLEEVDKDALDSTMADAKSAEDLIKKALKELEDLKKAFGRDLEFWEK